MDSGLSTLLSHPVLVQPLALSQSWSTGCFQRLRTHPYTPPWFVSDSSPFRRQPKFTVPPPPFHCQPKFTVPPSTQVSSIRSVPTSARPLPVYQRAAVRDREVTH
ncbi:uncharacterized protein LACBIDRAFT_315674 [Laccaria bicolor S238N-H82]|uniref:Predicted protein n=1 Tax=Laccaria bicolor (strain S238N-H82 / ATCC MYA-4686) TaxID=486041 RepID=B0D2W8_LACBS|nr:uncharacterized protein LACBIDRAFT_315674 [Laccaria bicolor S238N-H82]EDR11166.1 predicted protein [Laccaria bicolor S238N-H82]|eukprot:XP_001878467.1 predicted protein [Laccaria bicolor S238N-H82]